jgi:hypothetical protein
MGLARSSTTLPNRVRQDADPSSAREGADLHGGHLHNPRSTGGFGVMNDAGEQVRVLTHAARVRVLAHAVR